MKKHVFLLFCLHLTHLLKNGREKYASSLFDNNTVSNFRDSIKYRRNLGWSSNIKNIGRTKISFVKFFHSGIKATLYRFFFENKKQDFFLNKTYLSGGLYLRCSVKPAEQKIVFSFCLQSEHGSHCSTSSS